MAECERVLEPLQVEVDVQADLDLVDWDSERVGHDCASFRTESINSQFFGQETFVAMWNS
jgi:hypothetical protein